jgi:P pilus assembly chaperone PapD
MIDLRAADRNGRRRARIRRGWLPLLALLVGLVLPRVGFAFGIGIHPTTVEVALRPGGQHRQVLTVGNLNPDKSLALTVGLADWSLDADQQLQLRPPGVSSHSAADWVRFSPATLKLAPGESQRIVVEIRVPVDVDGPGDYRFGVLVSPVLPSPEERQKSPSGVWSRVQVSSLFYVTIPPAKPDAAVVDAQWRRSAEGTPEAVLSIHNRGNSHSRIVGELRLLDPQGKVALAQPINRVVLEGQTGRLVSPLAVGWRDLPAGSYRLALALEDYEGEVPVEVTSMPVLELPWLDLDVTPPDTP